MSYQENDQVYIAELVERARAAQKIVEGYSQRRVDELAAALIYTLSRPELAQSIAEQALAETHMGRVDSKIGKLTQKMPAVLYDILQTKTVGVIERIPEKGLTKIAKPMGVIAALIPSTNRGHSVLRACWVCVAARRHLGLSLQQGHTSRVVGSSRGYAEEWGFRRVSLYRPAFYGKPPSDGTV
jgi:DNA-binding TFAR19-related protein (PDSD5 family)